MASDETVAFLKVEPLFQVCLTPSSEAHFLSAVIDLPELEYSGGDPADPLTFATDVGSDFQALVLLMEDSRLFTKILEFCSTRYYCTLHLIHLHLFLLELRVLPTEVVDFAIQPHQVLAKIFPLKLGAVEWRQHTDVGPVVIFCWCC